MQFDHVGFASGNDSFSVLSGLVQAVDRKDRYTRIHSDRVTALAVAMGRHLDLSPEEVEALYIAGQLHDVGKIAVPESVLCKQGRLTDEEYRVRVENIEQYLAVPGNSIAGVNPMEWGALKPLDRERLQMGQSRRDDAAILDSIYTDPKKLTSEFLSQNWRKLTPETYRKLADTLAKPAAMSVPPVTNRSKIHRLAMA